MTRRVRIGAFLAIGVLLVGAALGLFVPRMCACVPQPEPPPPALSAAAAAALEAVAAAQERHYRSQRWYAGEMDSLGSLDLAGLVEPAIAMAGGRGWDLQFALDTGRVECTFSVRRSLGADSLRRRTRCLDLEPERAEP